ncbi:hypothetical protein RvY_10955-1 [Ramazzottius varieornatus]|uniref:Uncharacterized protein n=1 Tax=Ramazzottius varieornatus TaxID=947166 RepID=A0A1D1VGY0_RAMVA|nr:hypothetical protein RvY_10955-1 [Ramazzottius varieornatus]
MTSWLSFVVCLTLAYVFLHVAIPVEAMPTLIDSVDSEDASIPTRPLVLKVLISNSEFHDAANRYGPTWERIVKLAESLGKVSDLERYFEHRGRPRYG